MAIPTTSYDRFEVLIAPDRELFERKDIDWAGLYAKNGTGVGTGSPRLTSVDGRHKWNYPWHKLVEKFQREGQIDQLRNWCRSQGRPYEAFDGISWATPDVAKAFITDPETPVALKLLGLEVALENPCPSGTGPSCLPALQEVINNKMQEFSLPLVVYGVRLIHPRTLESLKSPKERANLGILPRDTLRQFQDQPRVPWGLRGLSSGVTINNITNSNVTNGNVTNSNVTNGNNTGMSHTPPTKMRTRILVALIGVIGLVAAALIQTQCAEPRNPKSIVQKPGIAKSSEVRNPTGSSRHSP